jgi:hypothetical protein
MLSKIIQLSEKRKEQNTGDSLIDKEIKLLKDLISSLKEKGERFEHLIDCGALGIFPRIFNDWPLDCLYPFIDLLRVLILFKYPAEYYYKTISVTSDNIFWQILKFASLEKLPFRETFLILKFITNLFKQPILRSLLLNHQDRICNVVIEAIKRSDTYTQDQKSKIQELISDIYINYSYLWKEGNIGPFEKHVSALKHLLYSYTEILFDIQRDETVLNLLVAFGTTVEYEMYINVKPTLFETFIHSPDERIRSCTKYVLALLTYFQPLFVVRS